MRLASLYPSITNSPLFFLVEWQDAFIAWLNGWSKLEVKSVSQMGLWLVLGSAIYLLIVLAAYATRQDNIDKKAKAKKLQILSAFADYHMEGRTLVIDKVHEAVYSKAYDKVEQEFDGTWHKNGIDTCARVGTTIYYKNKTMQAQIKKETACNYV
mgnify:CR=1 FL=1